MKTARISLLFSGVAFSCLSIPGHIFIVMYNLIRVWKWDFDRGKNGGGGRGHLSAILNMAGFWI